MSCCRAAAIVPTTMFLALAMTLTVNSVPAGTVSAAQSADVSADELVQRAYMYEHGIGVPKDLSKGAQLTLQAAQIGDSHAQLLAAGKYEDGIGVDKNHSEALRYLSLAAKQGNASAEFLLGRDHIQEGRDEEGLRLIRKAASSDGDAQLFLAEKLMFGSEIRGLEMPDWPEARRYFDLAVRGGNKEAKTMVDGFLEPLGIRVAGSVTADDLRHVLDRARGGDHDAEFLASLMYQRGIALGKDLQMALHFGMSAATSGVVRAQVHWGLFVYLNESTGLKQRGPEWLAAAAKAGDSEAQYWVARNLSDHGFGEKNAAAYERLMLQAAEGGMPRAQYLYGLRLKIKKDYAGAWKWLEKADTTKQVPDATNERGQIVLHGLGTKKDPVAAFRFFVDAAARGSVAAMISLGYCFAEGVGVTRDYKAAGYWWTSAQELTTDSTYQKRAQENLAILAKRLKGPSAIQRFFMPEN